MESTDARTTSRAWDQPTMRALVSAVPCAGSGKMLDDDLYIWDSRLDGSALVRVPVDRSSRPTVILEPPTLSALRLTGNRWALQRHEVDGRADLHVLDGTTGREEIVLEGIDSGFEAWNGPHASRVVESEAADEVVYSTTTSEGTTLWRFVP